MQLTNKSFLILVLIQSVAILASSCNPEPFALPIKDVQVEPNLPNSLMRGIPAKVGTPEQDIVLMPWAELNNTWIYDQQTYCDPNFVFSGNICLVRRGNPFLEGNSKSFSQSADILSAGGATQETNVVGSELGIPKLVSTSLAGTDNLSLASAEGLSAFPIGIPRLGWDAGYTTLHALGFGSNSTYLNYLKDAGRIGAKVWSIYWGRMWTTDNPIDGAVVLGGYDQSKIIGQNYTQTLDYSSTGCWTGMKVNIADIIVNLPDGNDSSLFLPNTVIPVCVVPQRQLLLEAPASVMTNFDSVTGTQSIGLSYGLHWTANLYNTGTQFEGDITIVLDSGLSVRVPNDQYVVPFVTWDTNGGRIFNDSQREVLIASIETQPATLGRYFLTAAYLMIDQEAQTFTFWQANPSTSSQLVRVQSPSDSKTCSNTTAAPSSSIGSSPSSKSSAISSTRNSTSVALIAGPVAAVTIMLLTAGFTFFFFFYLRRRNRQRQFKNQPTRPVSELPVPFRKFELHNDSISKQVSSSFVTGLDSNSGHRTSESAELHRTPMLQSQVKSWRGPVYEMSAGTPPILPPKGY